MRESALIVHGIVTGVIRGSRLRHAVAALVALGLSGLCAAPALGHGGLPVSTRVMVRGQQLYVPSLYWGIFVGSDSGPWRWICDEAINGFKLRDVFQGGDGTFYATDFPGLTLSHDGGCTWVPVAARTGQADAGSDAGGELSQLDVSAVMPDPTVPSRTWVAGSGTGVPGGVYRTDDAGLSWQRIYLADAALMGAAMGPDLKMQLVVVKGAMLDQPWLYTIGSAGGLLQSKPVQPIPSGVPAGTVVPLYVDPRPPNQAYLLFQGDPTQVLVLADGQAGTFTEILRLDYPIFSVSVDVPHDRLLVATGNGVFYADHRAALQRSSGLSRAQCFTVLGSTLYACSNNYDPDDAAVARSLDDGLTFKSVFQYAATQSVISCPAGTSVATVCPASWATNAPLLGITVTPTPGGADGGTTTTTHGSCQIGRPGGGAAAPGAWLLGVGLLALFRSRRCSQVKDRRPAIGADRPRPDAA